MKFEYITNSGVMSENIWGRNLCEGAKRPGPRERSDGAGVGCGRGCPSSHGRELLHFSTWKCAIWGTPKKEILIWRHVLYVWNWKKKTWFNFIWGARAPKPPTTSTPVITKVPYWNSGLMHTQDTVLTIRCSWRPQGLPELAWPCKCMQSGYQR